MSKSSIHIQKSVVGAVGHNSREHFSYSVVFIDDEVNECTHSQEQSYEIYRSELAERAEKYSLRTGQKMQKSTVTQLSSIINLEQHHTLKDLEPIKKHLEKIFDTKAYQMAIHRDEGKLISKIDKTELYSGKDFFLNTKDNELYFDKKFTQKIDLNDYEIVKNYHAHIEMLGLDSDGNAIRQKMNKVALQQLQTFVANELKMERGKENVSYSKDEMLAILEKVGKKTDYESTTLYAKKFNEVAKELGIFKEKYKRKDTHIFKDGGSDRESAKREVFKEVSAVQEEKKVLKKENTSLKSQNTKLTNTKAQQKELLIALKLENKELQGKLSNREEHAQREALNTKFKAEIKARDVTIEEIQVKFKELEEKLIPKLKKEISHLKSVIEIKDIDITGLNNQNKALQEQKEVLASKVTYLEAKEAHSPNMSDYKPLKHELNYINENIEIFEENYNIPKTGNIVKLMEWVQDKFIELKNIIKAQAIEISDLKEQLSEEVHKNKETHLTELTKQLEDLEKPTPKTRKNR